MTNDTIANALDDAETCIAQYRAALANAGDPLLAMANYGDRIVDAAQTLISRVRARAGDAVDDAAGFALAEVSRAMIKFPTWPTDPFHALAVVGEEAGELTKSVLQFTYEPHKGVTREEIREEAVQLAAMSLRWLVSLPAYQFAQGPQHDQSDIVPAKAPATAPSEADA